MLKEFFIFFFGGFFSSHKIFVLSRRNLFRINIYLTFPTKIFLLSIFPNNFLFLNGSMISFPFFTFLTLLQKKKSMLPFPWKCENVVFFLLLLKSLLWWIYLHKNKNIVWMKIFLWSINHNMIKAMRFLDWTTFLDL